MMTIRSSLIAAAAILTLLPSGAHAQLAPRPRIADRGVAIGSALLTVRPGREQGSAGSNAQVPLSVAARTKLLEVMAGPGAKKPALIHCDTSELKIGEAGQAVVMGDAYFYNSGDGAKCPPVGTRIKLPKHFLEMAP